MGELVAAAAATNGLWGVYSSLHEWVTLMTDAATPRGCPVAPTWPLWYPHYQVRVSGGAERGNRPRTHSPHQPGVCLLPVEAFLSPRPRAAESV